MISGRLFALIKIYILTNQNAGIKVHLQENYVKIWQCIVSTASVCLFLGCGSGGPSNTVEREPTTLSIVATTTMVADMVQAVCGDRAEVISLMGPGVDPHLYKPVASDLAKLRAADAIFYNGLMLEGKMSELLAARDRAFPVTEMVDASKLIAPEEGGDHHDPHLWGDIALWAECVAGVSNSLCAMDPDGIKIYEINAASYIQDLLALDRWVKDKVSEVPENHRVLITSHDAFNYLGRAYGFEVVAVQGISTVAEAGLGDITKTVDFIKSHEVKSIFVETSVNKAMIMRIAEDAGVGIGGELFSDAMGAPGTMHSVGGETYDEGTFEGMVKHNVNTIVSALK